MTLFAKLPTGDDDGMVRALKEFGEKMNEARKSCDHSIWDFVKHGRCCPVCGTFLVDFGD